ncbi:MAG TPA: hypothetical protein VKR54_02720 [Candidatus Babeliales bacterium]|jgi:hypothetical protein|nr:hypothetical protein [Candidatus Babeliales bacterium]
MKYGFALIELIVATLVASMVAGILLAALTQGNRFQMLIDNTIDTSTRIAVVANQLEKDLMGAFIPVQAEEKKDKQASPDKSDDAKNSPDKKDANKKDAGKKDEVAEKVAEKKEEKPIQKIFYSTNKGGKFDTLTFITNNPLLVYVGKDVGVVKPKIVRVQYSLKPETGKKDSFALFRQESMELDLEKYKDVREYEVIGGIKNFTITFTARIPKKDEKATDKEKQKILYEYKILNEWVSEQKKDAEKDKAEFPRIPYSVEIKMSLWDIQDKKETEFTIVCQIPVDFSEPKKDEKKQPEQPKKDDEVPGAEAGKSSKAQLNKVAGNQPSGGQVDVYSIEAIGDTVKNVTKFLGRV